MKKIFAVAAALIFSAGCTPKDPNEVIKRVDSRMYYLPETGLKSLSCKVNSPYIYEMFGRIEQQVPGSREILDQVNVDASFYWRGGYGSKFVIRGVPENLSEIRKSVAEVYRGTEILIIPPTEKEQFSDFTISMVKENDKLNLTGKNKNPGADFAQYDLIVDPKKWLVGERRYHGKNFVSSSIPQFETFKGKRYPVKIATVHNEDAETSFKSLVEMEYQETEGYWLVKKITYRFDKLDTGEKITGPVELNFSDCRINPTLNPETFKGDKVTFVSPEGAPLPAPPLEVKKINPQPPRKSPQKSPKK